MGDLDLRHGHGLHAGHVGRAQVQAPPARDDMFKGSTTGQSMSKDTGGASACCSVHKSGILCSLGLLWSIWALTLGEFSPASNLVIAQICL